MIETIEANFQIIVQMLIDLRNDGNIENGKRLSQYNCRSRKYFLIESNLLGK